MIPERIKMLQHSIPENIQVVAVSKMQPVPAILEAYRAGQRMFGENKARELALKHSQLPPDIEWHFIGHLQTNKVKYIAPCVHLIHSVDSLALLREINKEALKNNRVIDCLLQFHIATEETKFGMDLAEGKSLLQSAGYREMKNTRITGIMGMASFSDDTDIVRREFRCLREYFDMLKTLCFIDDDAFRIISMGMSGDYKIAIEEGSNLVRIGTAIFGKP